MNAEQSRLEQARNGTGWREWGPYLSERQWGTVREDYGDGNTTWNYLSHDQARSRAYRWGEDGLAGVSDSQQRLCFAVTLWNGADPILKERLFGLTNSEGNHGEDVKEYYFYVDSTPTHSYMRYLYKYPQAAYPYEQLLEGNRRRGRRDMEYELLDTGVFNDDRYFDVIVEYAKADPDDLLIRISAINRGPEAARLEIQPTLWFRNTWSWSNESEKPELREVREAGEGGRAIAARHREMPELLFLAEDDPELLFTDNETNFARLFGAPNITPWVKDAFHEYVVHGRRDATNPDGLGTKAAARYPLVVQPGETASVRLRLRRRSQSGAPFGAGFDEIFSQRRREADEFYASITPDVNPDTAMIMRQALAGMLWSKQFYYYDVSRWLEEHHVDPYVSRAARNRNAQWSHMVNAEVISMPDKWEYPWYAAWDLAFHAVALSVVDADFAKQQLVLVLTQRYMHPSGQIPAYEWNFGDVNPPVHAWACWYVYQQEKGRNHGKGDLRFLEYVFHRLLLNFTWWVNRKDARGNNVFEGGFLGLDNIGVFDRSAPLPTGGHLEQADGTAWMAFYCQCMLQIALELALHDPIYQNMVAKFYEHFLWIAGAMDRGQPDDLWDEQDGFFYDLLELPNGEAMRLKVRSVVGLLSICASTVMPANIADRLPDVLPRMRDFTLRHPRLVARISSPGDTGHAGRHLLSLLTEDKLRRVLRYMLDEEEFLSPFGIRAISRTHRQNPYVFSTNGAQYRVDYEPAESSTGMFGGNSNWRGPIWVPMNVLVIRALINLHAYYGNDFTVECPTGSGVHMNLFQAGQFIARRLIRIFQRDEQGARPVYGGTQKFQSDPHWRDLILFYEYFHGDNGAGLGASHQTGWTGVVASLIHFFGQHDAESLLDPQLLEAPIDESRAAPDQYARMA